MVRQEAVVGREMRERPITASSSQPSYQMPVTHLRAVGCGRIERVDLKAAPARPVLKRPLLRDAKRVDERRQAARAYAIDTAAEVGLAQERRVRLAAARQLSHGGSK